MDQNKAHIRQYALQALLSVLVTLQFVLPLLVMSSQEMFEPAEFDHHSQHEHHELAVDLDTEPSDCSDTNCHCECPNFSFPVFLDCSCTLDFLFLSAEAESWNNDYRFQYLKSDFRPPRLS